MSFNDIMEIACSQGEFDLGVPWNMDDIMSQVEKDALFIKRHSLNYVSIAEDDYPALLREIFDPPPVLFYRGVLNKTDKPMLAVVGTRHASTEGLEFAYELGKQIGANGYSVVSGLAFGIDAMAHRGNVDGGGSTIAVLGSSPDDVSPSSNRVLAKRILERGGAILSEYPPGTGACKWHFPQRNRIISGMCRSVIVVEAPKKSGALITADFALDQGRDLWVACDDNDVVFGEGCGRLTRDGAKGIHNVDEIFEEWDVEGENTGFRSKSRDLAGELARELEL
jgi:DNA processing protein